MRCLMPILLCLLLAAPVVQAQCAGQNILESLPPQALADLAAQSEARPYSKGNFWRATRRDQILILAGTYHLGDPRHDTTLARLQPYLDTATTLLVEAGPAEEAALRDRMAADPGTMMGDASGGLADQLGPDDWARLSSALLQRGIPSSLSARLRPWFVSMMLSIPPCALPLAAQNAGLDRRLIKQAQTRSIRITALEPYDTALNLFDGLTAEQQLTMIRTALAVEDRAADMLRTTSDAYFAGESRLIWDLNRLLTDQLPGADPVRNAIEFAALEQTLITARNQSWLPILEGAAENGPALAAFGALHLSGENGVLALLDRAGFTLTPLPF